MKHVSWLFACLIVLSACTREVPVEPAASATSAEPATSAAPTSAAPSPSCPSQDFDAFLARFVDDVAVQRQFTVIPFTFQYLGEGDPEPKPIIETQGAEEVDFPIIHDTSVQTSEGLVQSVTVETNGERTVHLVLPESDYLVDYHFRHDDCWRLYRMVDHSM